MHVSRAHKASRTIRNIITKKKQSIYNCMLEDEALIQFKSLEHVNYTKRTSS